MAVDRQRATESLDGKLPNCAQASRRRHVRDLVGAVVGDPRYVGFPARLWRESKRPPRFEPRRKAQNAERSQRQIGALPRNHRLGDFWRGRVAAGESQGVATYRGEAAADSGRAGAEESRREEERRLRHRRKRAVLATEIEKNKERGAEPVPKIKVHDEPPVL